MSSSIYPFHPHSPGFTSLCHPWASGIVQWLTEVMAGIKLLSPGFATFSLRPLTSVHATKPVAGKASIELRVDPAERVYEIFVPHGTLATEVVLPMTITAVSAASHYSLTHETEVAGEYVSLSPATAVVERETQDTVFLRLTAPLSAGKHVFSAPQASAVAPLLQAAPPLSLQDVPFGPAVWAGQLVGEDRSTQGNWIGTYGRDGYLIFSSPSIPPTPPPGPVCNLNGTWYSETAGDVITVSQAAGSKNFTTALNGKYWDQGYLRDDGVIMYEQYTGIVTASDGASYGCDYIRWQQDTHLFW